MLLEHNKNVYEQLCSILDEENCCCVVMGTGVGKTYVASEFLDENDYQALVVSPRNSINEAWKKHTKRVETVTYQKLANIYKDIDFSRYDVVICDEVHHIGAIKWSRPIKHIIDSNVTKVIGLTEDPVRYSDGARDVAEEFFHGNIAIGEDVPTAIEKKILNPVTYIQAMYNSDGLARTLKGRIQKRLYAKLNLVLNKTPTVNEILKNNMPSGKRKGIIFASTIEDIDFAIDFVHSVYPNVKIRKVHSKQSDAINEKNFEWFKKAEEGYLCSVDMISEGVHIKGVNTLIMLRRTQSVNLFNQQLGRCLDASSKEPAIIFDLVNNQYSVKIIKNKLRIKVNSIFNSKKVVAVASEQLIIKDCTKDLVDVLREVKDSLDDSNPWTDEEIKLLNDFYEKSPYGVGLKEFVKNNFPNRTHCAVSKKAYKLGLGLGQEGLYSEKEIEIIKKYYAEYGADYVQKLLPHRSRKSILAKAFALEIPLNRRRCHWSDKEIQIIKKYYPIEGRKVLKRLPGVSLNSLQTFTANNGIVHSRYKKIICVETGKVYDSALEAYRDICGRNKKSDSTITDCCKEKRKTAHGYHWKYVEEKEN